MTNTDNPKVNKYIIIRNLILSFIIGGFILIIAVLPAEYGIDPIGAGKVLGFEKLYIKEQPQKAQPVKQIKRRLVKLSHIGSPESVTRPDNATLPTAKDKLPQRTDEIKVVVPANRGIEYKFWAKQLGHLKYSWHTQNNETLFLDFHGEPKDSKAFYESYAVCYSNNMGGTFLVPFTGKHGWYFKNNTDKDITVLIKIKGEYKLMN